jgi:hypothetical protein
MSDSFFDLLQSLETLEIASLKTLLNELYRGTAPEYEVRRLYESVHHSVKTGRISWVGYLISILYFQEMLDSLCIHSPTQTALRKAFLTIGEQARFDEVNKVHHSERQLFTSNHDYRDAVRRHKTRMNSEAKDEETSTTKPLTTNELYGCMRGHEEYSVGTTHKIRGKKRCPETLYCNELIKSGLIF